MDSETKDVRDALRAYEDAVAKATSELNNRALTGDASLAIDRKTKEEKQHYWCCKRLAY